LNPKDEAELISNALFDEFGTGGVSLHGDIPYIDGRDAILEMKDNEYPGWGEVEWAGHHVKYLIQKLCNDGLSHKIAIYDLKKKRHFVKGNFIWDARFKAHESNNVPLGSVDDYEDITKKNGGIGILIVDALSIPDFSGDFRRWHEEQKGGSSKYSIERELDGRSERTRKTSYAFGKILSFFFTYDDLRKGVKDGWMKDNWQITMRNSRGESRTPKYVLKVNKIPLKYLVFAKNFNEDPEEFKEDYPEFS